MSFQDFMTKIRYVDNQVARWIMRHFYFMFFQAVLLVIFLFWFVNVFKVIDANYQVANTDLNAKIQVSQLINSTLLVFLMILNSFWLLFIFNIQQRIFNVLKDLNFIMNRFTRSGPRHQDHNKD